MGDVPRYCWPPLNVITPWHQESMYGRIGTATLGNAATLTMGANIAHYYQFHIYQAATAVKMTAPTGGTQNGNIDLGIYDDQKNRLVSSGPTAQAAANSLTTVDITDTLLLPGDYFMAVALSSATGTVMVNGQADEIILPQIPLLIQTGLSSGTLPNPAAWVVSTEASPFLTAIGVHFNTLI